MSAARIASLGLGLLIVCVARVWAADARCPASFATATGACDERVRSAAQRCLYPEGKCSCVRSTPCSGVPMPPGPPLWRCEAARKDGCPNDAPPQGATCAPPGRTCSYGNCGSRTYTCDAQKRTWFISSVAPPPPSSAGRGGVHPLATPTAPSPLPPQPAVGTAAAAPDPVWKTCPARQTFGCRARSQGAAPARDETVPPVCGCVPRCPASHRVLIAFEAEGRWPDGSRKGRFSCAATGIPAAAPARGM
jgi:hypothetical protein